MTDHCPVLIVILPLVAALVVTPIAYRSAALARAITFAAVGGAFVASAYALARVLETGPWRYPLAGWPPPWGIELVVDPLSGLMATLVSGMALLVLFYSGPYLENWSVKRSGIFHSLYLLLLLGLEGILVTGDLFNLYVFLEISSLSAYALLAVGGSRAVVATFRYLIIGTIAGSFYLLGVGYLYALTGTLNMADLMSRLPDDSPAMVVAVAFIAIGLAIKTALFPLHGWLPDAYTYAIGPVVGFIAAVMAKVSAYALYRILYFVLGAGGAAGSALTLLGWASVVAVVAGSVMALAQKDVQRMLAYSSVGQMGYIMLGFAIGTPIALSGALLHILAHATMKGCLFLAVNGVQWQIGVYRLSDFSGMAKRLPWTMGAFSIAALSMIGLPPTAGFFSKYYLALGALSSGRISFVVALVLSSLLAAVYFFRVIERSYLTEREDASASAGRELPRGMLIPIVVLALAVLLLGVFNETVVTRIIWPGLPG